MSRKKDTITRLPSAPKKLEAYFKTLPPEVIEGFAQNALNEDEGQDASEMAKLIPARPKSRQRSQSILLPFDDRFQSL
jgi:hypothetical protein